MRKDKFTKDEIHKLQIDKRKYIDVYVYKRLICHLVVAHYLRTDVTEDQ